MTQEKRFHYRKRCKGTMAQGNKSVKNGAKAQRRFNTNLRVIASPIPEEAQVTITTLSLNSLFMTIPLIKTIRYTKVQNKNN